DGRTREAAPRRRRQAHRHARSQHAFAGRRATPAARQIKLNRPAARTCHIYTDGACKGNPGPGGWGAVLEFDGEEREIFGGETSTTNNRMELMAVIEALTALTRPCRIVLHTDSQYVQKGITEWIRNWKA